jgi:hypothetical protein
MKAIIILHAQPGANTMEWISSKFWIFLGWLTGVEPFLAYVHEKEITEWPKQQPLLLLLRSFSEENLCILPRPL